MLHQNHTFPTKRMEEQTNRTHHEFGRFSADRVQTITIRKTTTTTTMAAHNSCLSKCFHCLLLVFFLVWMRYKFRRKVGRRKTHQKFYDVKPLWFGRGLLRSEPARPQRRVPPAAVSVAIIRRQRICCVKRGCTLFKSEKDYQMKTDSTDKWTRKKNQQYEF